MDTPFSLPPWLAGTAFQTPSVNIVHVGTAAGLVPIVKADANRAILLITGDPKGGVVAIGPTTILPNNNNPAGIPLGGSNNAMFGIPYLLMRVDEWGPLVTSDWYGIFTSGASDCYLLTVEYEARTWKADDSSDMFSKPYVQPKSPPAKISSAPGVNGRKGLLDYWIGLISKLGGR